MLIFLFSIHCLMVGGVYKCKNNVFYMYVCGGLFSYFVFHISRKVRGGCLVLA